MNIWMYITAGIPKLNHFCHDTNNTNTPSLPQLARQILKGWILGLSERNSKTTEDENWEEKWSKTKTVLYSYRNNIIIRDFLPIWTPPQKQRPHMLFFLFSVGALWDSDWVHDPTIVRLLPTNTVPNIHRFTGAIIAGLHCWLIVTI